MKALQRNVLSMVKALGPSLIDEKTITKNCDILFGEGEKFRKIKGLNAGAISLIGLLRNRWQNHNKTRRRFCKLFANGAGGMRGVVILNTMSRFIKN